MRNWRAYFPRVVVEPSQSMALPARAVIATRYCIWLASQYPWRFCSFASQSSARATAALTFGSGRAAQATDEPLDAAISASKHSLRFIAGLRTDQRVNHRESGVRQRCNAIV